MGEETKMKQIELSKCRKCKWFYLVIDDGLEHKLCLKKEVFIIEEIKCFEDFKK